MTAIVCAIDGGYQGPLFRAPSIMAQFNVEIVKRSGQAKTFVVLQGDGWSTTVQCCQFWL